MTIVDYTASSLAEYQAEIFPVIVHPVSISEIIYAVQAFGYCSDEHIFIGQTGKIEVCA